MTPRPMTPRPMTPRQRRFVEEYLIDLNATQAAKRAGYNPTWGRELVHKPEVAAAIESAQEKRAQRTRVSADRVVTEIAKVAFGDPRRLFSWGPGGIELRESSELTEAEAALVSEVSETRTAAGGTVAHDGKKFLLIKVSGDQQIAPLTLVVNWTEDLEEP